MLTVDGSNSVHLIKAVVLMHAAATTEPGNPKVQTALNQFVQDLSENWKQPTTDTNGAKMVTTATGSLVGASPYLLLVYTADQT